MTYALRERPDQPLPRGAVPEGTAPAVAVATESTGPADAVLLLTRGGQSLAQPIVRAIAQSMPSGEPGQWFSASLPVLTAGQAVDYRLELIRGGLRVASLPADGGWLRVAAETRPEPTPDAGCAMEFFATFSAAGRLEPIGDTPEGYRVNFLVDSGSVTGPRVDGVIQPGGGDWLCIRTDGVAVLDIRATFRTPDGAFTFYRAPGVLDLGPDGHAAAVAGQLRGAPTFHAAPTFLSADPAWTWLNRVQGFGVGRAQLDQGRVEYDVFLPRAHEHA